MNALILAHRTGLLYKMVLMTMIARVADGLPLAATMQEDEQVKHYLICIICLQQNILFFRQVVTYWIIRTKLRCYFESWVHNLPKDVLLKLDHTYSSKYCG